MPSFCSAVTVALLVAGSRQLADQSFDFGALVWIGFAFAVIGPLVITNLLWFTAIDRVGPSRASLFANLQPFLAALIALVLLSEPITAVQIVGGVAHRLRNRPGVQRRDWPRATCRVS